MPIWNNKPIDVLTDDELRNAFISVKAVFDNYNTKIQSNKYKERFKNRPLPEPNSNFTELYDAISQEVTKRGLT